MKLLGMLGRRLMQVAVTVVLVSLLVFGLMHLLPGDPALMLLGERGSDESVAALRREMGLDQPVAVQFWQFLTHAVTLRLGDSVAMRVPVATLIQERLPVTVLLTTMAAAIAILLAGPLAFAAALRPGSRRPPRPRPFAPARHGRRDTTRCVPQLACG